LLSLQKTASVYVLAISKPTIVYMFAVASRPEANFARNLFGAAPTDAVSFGSFPDFNTNPVILRYFIALQISP